MSESGISLIEKSFFTQYNKFETDSTIVIVQLSSSTNQCKNGGFHLFC